jgi:hypothetical protein
MCSDIFESNAIGFEGADSRKLKIIEKHLQAINKSIITVTYKPHQRRKTDFIQMGDRHSELTGEVYSMQHYVIRFVTD